jgi:hypothetical protein
VGIGVRQGEHRNSFIHTPAATVVMGLAAVLVAVVALWGVIELAYRFHAVDPANRRWALPAVVVAAGLLIVATGVAVLHAKRLPDGLRGFGVLLAACGGLIAVGGQVFFALSD